MKYTKKQALEKAVSQNRDVRFAMTRILDWDTTLTIPEQSKFFKRSRIDMYKFAQKYRLVFRRRAGRGSSELVVKKREMMNDLRQEGYLLKEIATIFKVKHQYVSQQIGLCKTERNVRPQIVKKFNPRLPPKPKKTGKI